MLSTQSTSVFHILPNLRADAAHPDHADKLMLFGQFIGVWAMDIKFFDEAGNTIFHGPGEWAFSWVLDGRAVQDVLTYAPLDDPTKTTVCERRIGSTLRYYDPKSDLWWALWLGATSGTFLPLIGKPEGDDIFIEGVEGDSVLNRWMFTEITPNSFHWTGQVSTDGGASWWMVQEMFARRTA